MSEGNGLPKGWVGASLEEVSVVDWGNTSLTKKAYVENGKYLAVSAAGCDGRIDFAEHKCHTPVISAIGTCGVAHYPREDFTAIKNTITLTPREGVIHHGFLFHLLTAVRLPQRGSNQRFIAKGDVQTFSVPIAPLPEQHRIVEKIEELFSDLDAGVASLERAKRNLKRYRASVLKSAVEGRLTEEWRREHPQAEDGQMVLDRILRERREKWEQDQLQRFREKGKEPPKNWQSKYEEPSVPDTSELPELPEGWVWATMPQLGLLDRGRSRHRPRNAKHLYGGKYPFIQTGDIRHSNTFVRTYTQTYSDAGLAQSRLWPAGTLCITIAANIAETAILNFDACFPDSVVGFLPATSSVSVRFLEAFLCTVQKYLEAYAPATAQKNINLETLSEVAIPLPPLAEQEQIVALVEERLSQIDSAEKTIDAELIRSKRLRQSILKRAFEGKLVPQDPKDEPASVLLERIKATREAEQPKKKAKKATKVKLK